MTTENPRMQHHCVKCDKHFETGYRAFCDECDGMMDVRYDLDQVTLRDSTNPYERYRDLLPILDPERLLPRDTPMTPTVHATKLGALLGMPWLYLKNETVQPSRSTKDRMAAVSLAYLWERGVRHFATSSTGNSSTAYARAMSTHPEMHLSLFTAEDWIQRVSFADSDQITHYCLRDATFVEAFNWASVHAGRNDIVPERGFFNIGRREGLKLAFFEATEQVPRSIDWYVQAISSAMGVLGTYKGSAELVGMGLTDRRPKLLCGQQATCSPMVTAFEAGSEVIKPEHVVQRPVGIAHAIMRGNPTRTYPYIRSIVVGSGGTFVSVTEDEIREAQKLVEDNEGISPCFSASTAMASVVKLARQGKFPTEETVLVNLTGGDRPPAKIADSLNWLRRDGEEWVPDAGPSA